jgi:hypothetical protein
MTEQFFERPILNSPYDYPGRHWELDESGQPTNRIIERRRRAEFITPIPKPKKRRLGQSALVFDEGSGFRPASSADRFAWATLLVRVLSALLPGRKRQRRTGGIPSGGLVNFRGQRRTVQTLAAYDWCLVASGISSGNCSC